MNDTPEGGARTISGPEPTRVETKVYPSPASTFEIRPLADRNRPVDVVVRGENGSATVELLLTPRQLEALGDAIRVAVNRRGRRS